MPPFLFSHVCDLLERIESLESRKPINNNNKKYSPSEIESKTTEYIYDWFSCFRNELILDKSTWLPLFSIVLPELRPDRVYAFRETGLINCISACLCLGKGRKDELEAYRLKANGDLGKQVEKVMAQAENMIPQDKHVSVQQVEEALNRLAGLSSFSAEEHHTAARRKKRNSDGGMVNDNTNAASSSSVLTSASQGNNEWLNSRKGILAPIYTCLSSRDAKWFTRVVLKCLLPVKFHHNVVFRALHFALPDIYAFRSDLRMAVELLGRPSFRIFPDHPAECDKAELRAAAGRLLVPEVGIKVGRPWFVKATSFDQVFKTLGRRQIAMERKYDGEYCQIHVDLEAGNNKWLRIFSKSGRDSTHDRRAAHEIIRKCLNIDDPSKRGFRRKCIVECEFLIYCEAKKEILGFHHVKDHVTRAGRLINATPGGPPSSQHVILKFFDCILLDDICLPCHSYDARRNHLERLIKEIPNHAELGERTVIDFNSDPSSAQDQFVREFARAVTCRWEGFVVKPCDGKYMNWGGGNVWIKLKKDYIPGLGDTTDVCIIGGAYEAVRGRERKLSSDIATTFHVGFMTNRSDVVGINAKPKFKVLFSVSYCLTKPDLEYLRVQRKFAGVDYRSGEINGECGFEIESIAQDLMEPDFVFNSPIVFEIMGAGFDRVNSDKDWVLRWPRVLKVYTDRKQMDTVDYTDFQKMAAAAVAQPANTVQEEAKWLQRFHDTATSAKTKKRSTVKETIHKSGIYNINSTSNKRHDSKKELATPSFGNILAQESRSSMNIPPAPKNGLISSSFNDFYEAPTASLDGITTPRNPKRRRTDITNTSLGSSSTQTDENTPPPPLQPSTPSRTSLLLTPSLPRSASSPNLARRSTPSKRLEAKTSTSTNLFNSPLRSGSVYLSKYLTTNNPRLAGLLARHGISTLGTADDAVIRSTLTFPNLLSSSSPLSTPSCSSSSSSASSSSSTSSEGDSTTAEEVIILVEERKRTEVRSLIESLIASRVKNVEIYSWRIMNRIDALASSTSSTTSTSTSKKGKGKDKDRAMGSMTMSMRISMSMRVRYEEEDWSLYHIPYSAI